MSRLRLNRSAVLFASAATLHGVAFAEPVSQEDLDALDLKIRILERKLEIEREEEAKAEATTASASENGFTIESGDGAFTLKLKGLVQGDSRVFIDDEDTANDTFFVRRARPTLEGTVGDFVSFKLMPDFGGSSISLIDAYLDVEAVPAAILRAGKFKRPVGLERLQSASNLHMIERGYPTELAPNRDIGLQLYTGGLINGKPDSPFTYALAIANGTPDGRDSPITNPDDNFESAVRVFAEPIKGLDIGIAGSFGDKEGGAGDDAEDFLPRYRSPAQQTIFTYAETTAADGQHLRWSPQSYYYVGPFGVLAGRIHPVRTRRHERRGQRYALAQSGAGYLPSSCSQAKTPALRASRPTSPSVAAAGVPGNWRRVTRGLS